MPFNDGGPAFPQHGWSSNPDVLDRMKNQSGMSLWDFYAVAALTSCNVIYNDNVAAKRAASACADYADAMLAEREKRRANRPVA